MAQTSPDGGWVEAKGRWKKKGKRTGDATPALLCPEKPHTVRTSWAGKVKGDQVGREREKVDEKNAFAPFSRTPRQPERVQGTWQGSHAWGEKGGRWQQRPREHAWEWDAHTGRTWAEEVELTQEVWYAPDGTVLGVGPPSPSSSPWLTLLQPSPPLHAHTDRFPSSFSTGNPSQRRRGMEMEKLGPAKSGFSSCSFSFPNSPPPARRGN